MADEFKGLTIKLGADARSLKSAISSIQRESGKAGKQLNAMTKALKVDPSNVNALNAALELSDDRATLAARSMGKIQTAMKQAVAETKSFDLAKVAGETSNAYSKAEKLRSAYNNVDAELQHVYDAVKLVVRETKNMTVEEADKHVKNLQRDMGGAGEKAKLARVEMEKLVRAAAMSENTGLRQAFGISETEVSAGNRLVSVYKSLRSEQVKLNQGLSDMKRIEGYRAMETQLISWEAEIRKAVSETTDFKVQLASLGKSGSLSKQVSQLKRIDQGLDDARASARAMSSAFDAMPKSMEVATAKARAFRDVSRSIDDKLSNLRQTLRKIEGTPGFDKVAASTKNVYAELARAKNGADDMRVALKKAEASLESLVDEAKKLKQNKPEGWEESFKKVKEDTATARKEVERYREEVRRADDALDNAAMYAEWRKTKEAEVEATAEANRYSEAVSRASAHKELFGSIRTAGYGLASTITPAVMMAGRYAIQAAEDFDSAYRDMRKTVNGTEEDFERLKDAAVEFSLTHVTSAEQIMEIEAIGGQLGVAVENLEGFAHTVSNLDIATNMDTEQIAENLGQLAYIMDDMDQSQESLDSFADALVRLGNNSATQEDKIMNVMMRIASMGTILNMPTYDLLALSTAVAASGQGAEAAGTAISKTFSNIESAVSGPESAMKRYGEALAEGGEDLEDLMDELEESSGDLEAFAKIAGMSADEFAAKWHGSGEEVMDVFQAFVEGLHNLKVDENGSIDAALMELGIRGVRQKQTLMNLSQTVGELDNFRTMSKDAWNGIADEWGQGSDALVEAEKKSEGFSGQLEMMRNNAKALGIELAEGATPFVKMLSEMLHGLTEFFRSIPAEAKTAIVGIGGIAAALGPTLIAAGAVGNAFVSIPEAIAKLKSITKHKRAVEEVAEGAGELSANIGRAGKGAGSLKAALGGIGGAAVIAAIAAEVGMLGYALYDAHQKSDLLKQSTDGLVGSAKALDSIKDAESKVHDYAETVYGESEKLAGLAASTNEAFAGINTDSALARHYIDLIAELKDGYDGSLESLTKLEAAIDGYNEVTGDSLTITDETTGALSKSTEELYKNAAAWEANAKAQAAQELLKEAYKEQIELENKLAESKQRVEDAQAALNATEGMNQDIRDTAYAELAAAEAEYAALSKQYDSLVTYTDQMSESYTHYREKAKLASQTTDNFRRAIAEATEGTHDFDEIAASVGMEADDLAAKLATAEVSAEQFAQTGRDEFLRLYHEAHEDLDAVIRDIAAVDQSSAHPKITVEDHASDVIERILSRLSEVDRTSVSAGVTAAVSFFKRNEVGGLSPRIIRAIPRNAAGGINGIVTRPMLTNVGWVGEAGDEALLHMKNAGGAIIPLSNRQHVRPFAQAVAYEMGSFQQYDGSAVVRELQLLRGSLSNGQVNINVTVNGAGDDYGEIGRRVGREAAYELRMQGVCA